MSTVETKASLLAKINAQSGAMINIFPGYTKQAVALVLLGWTGKVSDATQELLDTFISVIKNTLESKEPPSKDLEKFIHCIRDNSYYPVFLDIDPDIMRNGVTFTKCIFNEEQVKYPKFSFVATKGNMLTFLHALEVFVAQKDTPEVVDKFILSVIDEDGKVNPVGPCEHMQYSASRFRSDTFRLADYVLFDSVEQIKDVIAKHPAFTKPNIYADGHSSPPMVLWSGLGICNDRMSSEGTFRISKVVVETVEEIPTGVYAVTKGTTPE